MPKSVPPISSEAHWSHWPTGALTPPVICSTEDDPQVHLVSSCVRKETASATITVLPKLRLLVSSENRLFAKVLAVNKLALLPLVSLSGPETFKSATALCVNVEL